MLLIVQTIIKAGLIEAHRDMMIHVHGVRFGWDLADERNMIAVHQRIGLLVRRVMANAHGDLEALQ